MCLVSFLFLSLTVLLVTIEEVHNATLESMGVKNSLYDIPGLGNRPLIIKAFPGIDNVQSDLYEVYAEPYMYELRAQLAVAVIQGEEENGPNGELLFIQKQPPIGQTFIRGNITGLPPGKHGLHIHQSGDLRQGCEKLGGHFNPYQLQHGGPTDPVRHAGDLGNIEAGEDGTAEIFIVDPLISLSGGPRGIVGRALVISSDVDDLGRGGSADSLVSGNSGQPIACAVIAYVR